MLRAYLYRTKGAFSLFEASVSIVILGILGIICSSMLLNISKNISFSRASNDTSITIALLKIENLLQNALIDSILDEHNKPLSAPTSSLHFASIEQNLLFGGGFKNTTPATQNDTLLPSVPISVESSHDSTLYFATSHSWHIGAPLYIFAQTKAPFTPYYITHTTSASLTFDKPLPTKALLALPISMHTLKFTQNTLWLDNAPLIFNITSFSITPHAFAQGTFLEVEICAINAHCEMGGVWLDEMVAIL